MFKYHKRYKVWHPYIYKSLKSQNPYLYHYIILSSLGEGFTVHTVLYTYCLYYYLTCNLVVLDMGISFIIGRTKLIRTDPKHVVLHVL